MKPTDYAPARRRIGRRRRREVSSSPAPVALTLVAAGYAESQYVEMTFDRAIDISAIVVSAINVDDGPISGVIWRGTSTATLVGPATVRVPVTEFDASSSPATVLNASAATGIVAVDDGGTWAGVSALPLPFNA